MDSNIIKDLTGINPRFNNKYKFFCMYSAVDQLLNIYGIDDAETLLDNTIDFEIHEDSSGYKAVLGLSPLLDKYKSYVEIFYCDKQEDNFICSKDIESINDNLPVIIGTDYYYLPYHKQYMKKHGAHAVLLIGYNNISKNAYIIDFNSAFYSFEGHISYEILHAARHSNIEWNGSLNSGGNISGVSIIINLPILKKMKNAAVDNILYTFDKQIQQYYLKNKEDNSIIAGINAVYYLLDKMQKEVSEQSIEDDKLSYLYTQLIPQAEKKKILCEFIRSVNKKHFKSNSKLHYINSIFDNLNENWVILVRLLLKYAQRKSRYLQDEIIKQILIVKEMEYRLGESFIGVIPAVVNSI